MNNKKISKNLRADIMREEIIDRTSFESNKVSIIYSKGQKDKTYSLDEYTVEVLTTYTDQINTVLSTNYSGQLNFTKIDRNGYLSGKIFDDTSFITEIAAYNYCESSYNYSIFSSMIDTSSKATLLDTMTSRQISNLQTQSNLMNRSGSLFYNIEHNIDVGDTRNPIYIKNNIMYEATDKIGINKYIVSLGSNIDLNINHVSTGYITIFTEFNHIKKDGNPFSENTVDILNYLKNLLPCKCNCLWNYGNRVFLGEIKNLYLENNNQRVRLTLSYQLQEDDKIDNIGDYTNYLFPNNTIVSNGIDHYGYQKVYITDLSINIYDVKYYIM